jgi:hypothetical protein
MELHKAELKYTVVSTCKTKDVGNNKISIALRKAKSTKQF